MELWFTERHTPYVNFSIKVERQLYTAQSEFQRIDVFESREFGRFLTLDGYMMLTEKDEFIYHEMITHIPMAVHPNPENILVIGAGDGGVVRELTRYQSPKCIDLVEIDELVIGKHEHVRGSRGVFEIAALAVYGADGAELKHVFLFRVRSGKIVAELFRQLQLDLIGPHLERDGFLLCRFFRDGLFRRGLRRFGRGAAAAGQQGKHHTYCHQQCKDLLHRFGSFIVLSQKELAFC